jgi:5-(carboxyamino)imidazole ribonucleotide mutase
MPSGSPVVSVGVNKAGNAGIYAMKILANEFPDLKKKLKQHKSDQHDSVMHKSNQHDSVMKESEQLKKEGLSKFVKKKFK